MTFAPERLPSVPTSGPSHVNASGPEPASARLREERSAAFRALAGARTPLTPSEASAHLSRAYQAVTGQAPSPATLSLLWAQWALETGRGKSMFGNNFGGIKARAGAPGKSFATFEGFSATRRRVIDRFRTYATPEEGARDYVRLLAERYPDAFEAAQRGDLPGFSQGLARRGYFTARPETYQRGLERLASEHATGVTAPATEDPVVRLMADGVRHWLSRRLDREE
jgi:hypothetical protein